MPFAGKPFFNTLRSQCFCSIAGGASCSSTAPGKAAPQLLENFYLVRRGRPGAFSRVKPAPEANAAKPISSTNLSTTETEQIVEPPYGDKRIENQAADLEVVARLSGRSVEEIEAFRKNGHV